MKMIYREKNCLMKEICSFQVTGQKFGHPLEFSRRAMIYSHEVLSGKTLLKSRPLVGGA